MTSESDRVRIDPRKFRVRYAAHRGVAVSVDGHGVYHFKPGDRRKWREATTFPEACREIDTVLDKAEAPPPLDPPRVPCIVVTETRERWRSTKGDDVEPPVVLIQHALYEGVRGGDGTVKLTVNGQGLKSENVAGVFRVTDMGKANRLLQALLANWHAGEEAMAARNDVICNGHVTASYGPNTNRGRDFERAEANIDAALQNRPIPFPKKDED